MPPSPHRVEFAATDIPGFDDVVPGGFVRPRLYLIEGVPGSGKTTLALQFLRAAAARGEPVLYVTLSETDEELRATAASHDWDLDGVTVLELVPPENTLDPQAQVTMFHASEVELSTTLQELLAVVDRVRPTCLVVDSLSELRLLAGNPLRYRRNVLALKQILATKRCTTLLLDDMTGDQDLQTQSMAHGVIHLEHHLPEYGAQRRRLRVLKYRGVAFRGGYHDYVIRKGGLAVFPRLVASEHRHDVRREILSSGLPGLDTLVGGGLERGTSTLVVGAAGTGKSTLAAQFAAAAAARGERAAMYIFDESPSTLLTRADQVGIPLRAHVESGAITLQQVDPAELTPGEFTKAIEDAVVQRRVSVVVIDSLNGFLNAMPGERYLTVHLHELLMYLGHQSVATILVGAHQGLIGGAMQTPVDASYLADAVILLRYFEAFGEVHQAISVMKKRGGRHERTIREYRITSDGIQIGEPLRQFRGVLTGVPIYQGPVTETTGEQRVERGGG